MVTDEQTITKNQVAKVGNLLRNEVTDEALQALSNWRAMHAQPLNTAYMLLKRKAEPLDKQVILSQRLKRLPSIIEKLNRYPKMKLDRMQDMGGCRAVLASQDKVLSLAGMLTKKAMKMEKDYYQKPKRSGYRSLHLSYKYKPTKEENMKYEGLVVEVQLRTLIQHAWATAVEIVGLFNREMLKASKGDSKWLEFFARVSDEFAKLEGLPLTGLYGDDNIERVKALNDELKALDTLSLYRVTTDFIDKKNDDMSNIGAYFLLMVQDGEIRIIEYKKHQYQRAVDAYLAFEKQFGRDKNTDIVLIDAQPIKALKKAYPNYFADSHKFVQLVRRVTG